MADQGSIKTESQQDTDDPILTQTVIWPASTFVTTWTMGGSSDTAKSPATVSPASNTTTSDNSLGPALSGIVVFIALLLVLWLCCRRNHAEGRNSRRSSRRQESSHASKGGSCGPGASNDSSLNDVSVGTAASEAAEGQWIHPESMPEGPTPEMPPPVAGGWPAPLSGQGIRPGPLSNLTRGFQPHRGGPPPTAGRGGPPLLGRGEPPPIMGQGALPHGIM